MKKLGLLPRLIIAIVIGILLGSFAPIWVNRIFVTFSGIFGNFLNFIIPLIIMGFVIPGIADLGDDAGKSLAITVALAYGSTVLFGSLAYFVGAGVLPMIVDSGTATSLAEGREALAPFFESPMEPIMDVTAALIISFILGVGIAATKAEVLKKAVHEFSDIISKLISFIIIPLLPLHIVGIFANMAYQGTVANVLSVFIRVFILILILHWLTIFIQFTIAHGVQGEGNPFRSIRTMIPAYMTAVGTQSSAATIPVTLRQTYQVGVNKGVADFVIPLCSTIHLSGSTITILTCSLTLLLLTGQSFNYFTILPFILMLGVTMVAAPGVPGGAIMAALGILETMLAFDQNMLGLMIALYVAQDSFGTACNVTGDCAISIIVNKVSGYSLDPEANKEYLTTNEQ